MEAIKYRVISEVVEKRLKAKHAAEELGLSTRQVRRLVKKVKREGANGLIHGLVGQKSNRAFTVEGDERILYLWENKYYQHDFNFLHFTNKLNEIENVKVSHEKVRQLLTKNGFSSKCSKKHRKHRKKRDRKPHCGDMIQQDTSPHDWLGDGVVRHLVVSVDDATSKILFMKLFSSDGTLPNMEAFKHVMTKYGLPNSYYVDGAAWFTVTRNGNSSINRVLEKEKYTTQIARALRELGVRIIIAKSPQGKGRVERSNRTLQDRLISELRLENITSLEKANEYITNVFIDDYNRRFSVAPTEANTTFVTIANKSILDRILCVRLFSSVKNDNTIKKAKLYELQLLPTQKRCSWAKAKVEVSMLINGEIEVRHQKTKELIPFEKIMQRSLCEYKHAKQAVT